MDNNGDGKTIPSSYYLKVEKRDEVSSSRSPSPNRSIKGLNLFRMINRKIGKNNLKQKDVISSDEDENSNSSSNSLSRPVMKNENGECDCDYFYKRERSILRLSSKNRSNSFTGQPRERDKSKEYHSRNERCLRFTTPCNGYHQSVDVYSSNDDSSNSNDSDRANDGHRFSSNDSSASSSSGSYRNSRDVVRKVLKSLNLNSRSLSCSSVSQMKGVTFGERRDINSKEKRTKKSPQKILRQPVTYTYVRGISGLPTHRVVNTRGCYNHQYSRG